MLETLYYAFNILDSILNKGAFSSLELSKNRDNMNKQVTRIVYGVLDKKIQLEYYLSQLVNKIPKPKIKIILLIGMYIIYYMDSIPDYAAVDNSVELVKRIGKHPMTGFVNAVLKRAIGYNYSLPQDMVKNISISLSKPEWLVEYYLSRYDEKLTKNILSSTPYEMEHIRHNSLKIDREKLKEKLKDKQYEESDVGGFIVRVDDDILSMFNDGLITFQSYTSMVAVLAMEISGDVQILDTCSAPGGKAVFMAESNPKSFITAMDIHPHRVELIEKYTKRMGVSNIHTEVCDATIFRPEYKDKFDYILCDVPCSGLGLINKKPDIMLKKPDFDSLSELQYNIINTAAEYLKPGGMLVYSTCTTIDKENEGVIEKFLNNHKEYSLDPATVLNDQPIKNFLPLGICDGYFVARMKRL